MTYKVIRGMAENPSMMMRGILSSGANVKKCKNVNSKYMMLNPGAMVIRLLYVMRSKASVYDADVGIDAGESGIEFCIAATVWGFTLSNVLGI
jgi:hypothetical protein